MLEAAVLAPRLSAARNSTAGLASEPPWPRPPCTGPRGELGRDRPQPRTHGLPAGGLSRLSSGGSGAVGPAGQQVGMRTLGTRRLLYRRRGRHFERRTMTSASEEKRGGVQSKRTQGGLDILIMDPL